MPTPTSTKDPDAPGRGEPLVAVLLTWFVPGAGHLYLGRTRTAVLAFVVVELLYGLGLVLSEGRFLEYLPPEMRSRFAGMLAPEVGNLGALLFHTSKYGYGTGTPSPWPTTMDLGTMLTAASGIVNLFVMSSAHFAARAGSRGATSASEVTPVRLPQPGSAALMTWLVPGLGHWFQGRRARAVVAFVLLVGLFGLASFLAEGANLDRERHFYYWSGQYLLGLPAVLVELAHGHPRLTHEIPYNDAGVVLGCVAGMLNVLLMLDAYGYSESKILGTPLGGDGSGSPDGTSTGRPASHVSPNPPPGYGGSA